MNCSLTLLRQLVGLVLLGLAGIAPTVAQTDARLVGSWEVLRVLNADGTDDTAQNDGAVMTFLADGTLTVRFYDTGRQETVGEEITTTYRIESDVIVVLDTNGAERSLFYRFEGDELVLTPDPTTQEVAYLRRTQ